MSRQQRIKGVVICKQCSEGFDGWKSLDRRGSFCSPACLTGWRMQRRGQHTAGDEPAVAIGPAALPAMVSLGSLAAMITLEQDLSAPPGDHRRLI